MASLGVRLHISALVGFTALLALPAFGTTVFTLDQNGCGAGCNVIPFGTVQLTQTVADTVSVSVQLGTDYSFRRSNDASHHSFAFNLAVASANISNIVSGNTQSQTFTTAGPGAFTMAPFGTFQYKLDCSTCVPGVPV